MRTIRVANVSHLGGLPYRELSGFDFIKYEENPSFENSRKLHEGEVDLALISASEFATHGGYVGLDFGVACTTRSDSMYLYAAVPVHQLETIHVYSAASSSVFLLRFLLAKRWKCAPKIVRETSRDMLKFVRGREGALLLHEDPDPVQQRFPVEIDIVREWIEMTGRPYVSLLWALRPGTLRPEHLQFFNDTFHRFNRARGSLAESFANIKGYEVERFKTYITKTREYYLDVALLDALDDFLIRAADAKMLPKIRYSSATLTLISRRTPRLKAEKTVSQILDSALDGNKVGIRDGVRLAYEASTADLALVADSLRADRNSNRQIRCIYQLSEPPDSSEDLLIEHLLADAEKSLKLGVTEVHLPALTRYTGEPAVWCEAIRALRDCGIKIIEGLSPFHIRWMSALAGKTVEQVVADLIEAGLSQVGGDGGEMLVDRVAADATPGFLSASDWLGTLKWVHHLGATSMCSIR